MFSKYIQSRIDELDIKWLVEEKRLVGNKIHELKSMQWNYLESTNKDIIWLEAKFSEVQSAIDFLLKD